jgi:hypothetical protein
MSAARYAVMSLRYAKGNTFSRRMDHAIGTYDDEYQYFAA